MLWALNSHAVHELLVVQRGWTPSGTGIWLTDTLAKALLPHGPVQAS